MQKQNKTNPNSNTNTTTSTPESKNNKLKLALSALGVLGAATAIGIAIYKHKNPVVSLDKINFDKGIASLKKTGENYTGQIKHTYSNGDKIVLEYIQKRPAFKDPLLVKRMYSTMRGLDDAIQKAHENALKAFDDDPEKRQAEQKKLDEQTPIRFEFKAEDTHLLSQEINEDPQAVVARMLAGFKTPDINEETIAVQRRQMDRMNKQITDKMGMDVQEYQDLWRKQQEEDAQKRIPGTDYDLTDVILQEDEISVSK